MTDDNGLNVADGTYQFVFRLYTVASGGSATWSETVSLSVVDGIFHHNLGSTTPLPGSVDFDTDNIFLGITFNSDPDGEMSPRIQLTASPYAFNSDQLDGLDASDFVQLSPSVAQTGNISITGTLEAGGAATALRFVSTVATGTAPMAVSSTTLVTNLNSDLLDGQHGSYYRNATNLNAGTINNARLSSDVSLLGQTIGLAELEASSVDSSKIVDGSIANADLASDSVDSANIVAGSIDEAHMNATNAPFTDSVLQYGGSNNFTWVDPAGISGGVTSLNGMTGSLDITSSSEIGILAASSAVYLSIQNDAITDTHLVYNTGQHLTVTSSPTFAALTVTGTVTASSFSGSGASLTSLNAGNISAGTLGVARGGTGVGTHTVGGILYGNGTGAITNSGVLGNGQLLIGDGSGAPTVATLTAGTGISITNGAGSITINASGGAGGDILQGGNSFGSAMTIGTNDAQALNLETNNTTRLSIASNGNTSIDSGVLFVNAVNNSVGINTTSVASGYGFQVGDGSGNVNINLAPSSGGLVGIDFDNAGGSNGIYFDNSNDVMSMKANGGELSLQWDGVRINRNLFLGTETGTDTLLVLDNKTTSGDPTGQNGALYYNSNASKFRCYEGGVWKDCISASGGGSGSLFTDAGAHTYLTSTTDQLVVGSTSSMSAKMAIVGTANQAQLLIRGNATQTSPLVLAQDSSGNELFRIHAQSSSSIFIGSESGANNTGIDNVGLGRHALMNNTSGTQNYALGVGAMQSNTSGGGNSALGYASMNTNSTGSYNVALGTNTLRSNSTGWWNTAVGYGAGLGASGNMSDRGTYIGAQAGSNITSSVNSTLLGYAAGYNLTNGSNNILLGYQAGDNLTTGSSNIIIGYDLDASSVSVSNQLRIGSGSNITLQADLNTMAATFNGALSVGGVISGDGSGITNLNASSLASGTVPSARISGSYSGITGTGTLAAGSITSTFGSINIGSSDFTGRRLQLSNGIGLGSGAAINSTHLGRNSLQIVTNTAYGGTLDNHSGYLVYSTMATGWGNAQLVFAASTGWGSYNTSSPSLIITDTGLIQKGSLIGARLAYSDSAGVGSTNYCRSATAGLFGFSAGHCTSLREHKHNISNLSIGLETLRQLNPVEYDWKDPNMGGHELGFIAEEVAAVNPMLAEYSNGKLSGVKYNLMTSLLTKSVQQLDLQVQSLDVKSQNLETRTMAVENVVLDYEFENLKVMALADIASLKVSGDALVNGNLNVVNRITTKNITITGHIATSGQAPRAVLSSATGQDFTVEVDGNDTSGTIAIITNLNAISPDDYSEYITEIIFAEKFNGKPRVIMSPSNKEAVASKIYSDAGLTTPQAFKISIIEALTPSTTYKFNYWVVE